MSARATLQKSASELNACKQTLLLVKLACTVWTERSVLGHGYRCSECTRLSVECADVCLAAMRLLETDERHARADALSAHLQACRRSCGACSEECIRHGSNDAHLRLCLELCRRLGEQCRAALIALGKTMPEERNQSGTRAAVRPSFALPGSGTGASGT